MKEKNTLKMRGVRFDDEHHMLLNYLKGARNMTHSEILHSALDAFATKEEHEIADRIYQESLRREKEKEKEKNG